MKEKDCSIGMGKGLVSHKVPGRLNRKGSCISYHTHTVLAMHCTTLLFSIAVVSMTSPHSRQKARKHSSPWVPWQATSEPHSKPSANRGDMTFWNKYAQAVYTPAQTCVQSVSPPSPERDGHKCRCTQAFGQHAAEIKIRTGLQNDTQVTKWNKDENTLRYTLWYLRTQ